MITKKHTLLPCSLILLRHSMWLSFRGVTSLPTFTQGDTETQGLIPIMASHPSYPAPDPTPKSSTISQRPQRHKANRLPPYSYSSSSFTPAHSYKSLSFCASTNPITQRVNAGLFLWKCETAYQKFDFWHKLCA